MKQNRNHKNAPPPTVKAVKFLKPRLLQELQINLGADKTAAGKQDEDRADDISYSENINGANGNQVHEVQYKVSSIEYQV